MFSKSESIIITDIEDIKEEHRMMSINRTNAKEK